jgi:uncharacterized protein (DUF4415 family)
MKKQRVAKSSKNRRGARAAAAGKTGKSGSKGKRAGLTLTAAATGPKRRNFALSVEFYRPLKKPVTLRLDADVLAWFKKDGRRYQTRINGALRKVMEREMRAAKG